MIQFGNYPVSEILNQRVFTRQSWSDDWTHRPEVHCVGATWVASPSLPEATIYYRYGKLLGDGVFEPFELPSLAYVKIEFDAFDLSQSDTPLPDRKLITLQWFGVVGRVANSADGGDVKNESSQPIPTGYQSFQCVGMEWLIERQFILHADVAGQRIDHAPAFNLNRSGQTFSNDADGQPGDKWSSRDVVKYLIENHSTPDEIDWEIENENLIPDFDDVRIEQHGFTVASLLKQIISRQRGLGYFFAVRDNKVKLIVFTFTDSAISLPSGNQLPANTIGTEDITFSADHSGNSVFVNDSFSRYDSVRVIGSRATLTFSATPERVDDRDLKALANEAIGDETDPEKVTQIISEFISDPDIELSAQLHRVDFGDLPQRPTVADPDMMQPEPTYRADKLILNRTALQVTGDYADDSFPDDPPALDVDLAYLRPFWLVSRDNKWYDTQFIANSVRPGFDWAASIVSSRAALTFELNSRAVVLSQINSTQRSAEILALHGSEPWDLSQSMATVTIQLDHYCEFTATVDDPPEVLRVKRIGVGGNRRLDLLAAGTVVGVDANQELIEHSGNSWIRDDRDELELIANLALSWYSSDRQSVEFSSRWLSGNLQIGTMVGRVIDNAVNHEVNAPITLVSVTSPVGSTAVQPSVIRYATSFAELDVAGYA